MNLRTTLSRTMILGMVPALVAVACGGGSSGKQQTVSDFCAQYATSVCNVTSACGPTLTTATCETTETAACMTQASTAQAAGVRSFTPGNVSACVNLTATIYKQATPITPTQMANTADACNYVFQGSVASGMPCTTKYDCAGKVICDKGVCATPKTKNKGDGCSDAGAVCAAGSFCQKGTNGFFTCVAKAAMNAACDDATPCLETLRCMGGKCVARAGMGDACASNDDCGSTVPYCDPFAAGGTCDPGLRFAPGSASCGQFSGLTGTGGSGGSAGTGGAGGTGGSGSDGAAGADGSTDAGGDGAVTSDQAST